MHKLVVQREMSDTQVGGIHLPGNYSKISILMTAARPAPKHLSACRHRLLIGNTTGSTNNVIQ